MPAKNHPRRTRQIIKSFEAKALKKRPLTVKVADWLTSYFGSISFLLINVAVFIFWIVANSGKIPGVPIFDPYPYVFLVTAVSLEAIILTSIVLMSQNRQNQINTLRDELQLQVELITEKEITKILKLLNELLKKNNIKIKDEELLEMLETINTSYIEKKLEEQLSPKPTPLSQKVAKPIVDVGKRVGKSFTPKK